MVARHMTPLAQAPRSLGSVACMAQEENRLRAILADAVAVVDTKWIGKGDTFCLITYVPNASITSYNTYQSATSK